MGQDFLKGHISGHSERQALTEELHHFNFNLQSPPAISVSWPVQPLALIVKYCNIYLNASAPIAKKCTAKPTEIWPGPSWAKWAKAGQELARLPQCRAMAINGSSEL